MEAEPLDRALDQALDRAKSYPYFVPARSYVLGAGGYSELPAGAPLPDLAGRRAVLACGSNRSPVRLAEKFPRPEGAGIPVIHARLSDFDAVYSAHFSAYGAIPATLQPAPGAVVGLSVTWLTDHELARMHETEIAGGNYDFGVLEGVHLELDGGPTLDRVSAYVSRRGCLAPAGAPLALAAVAARGRLWTALSQTEILSLARDRLAPGQSLHHFVRETITDRSVRRARIDALADLGQAFSYANFRPALF